MLGKTKISIDRPIESRTRRDKVEEEMGHYAELKTKLSSIMVREEEGPLEMLTELGADCFAKAKVRQATTRGLPCIYYFSMHTRVIAEET